MAFVLTEEQELLRSSARQFFSEQLPLTMLRELRRDAAGPGYDPASYKAMAELGFCGILIDDAHGGTGFGYTGMGLVLQEAGRHLSPSPLYASGILAASTLMACGSPEQKKTYLPKIASGEIIATLAVEESGHHNPPATVLDATRKGDTIILNGTKRFVPDGQNAHTLIVLAREAGEAGDTDGLSLFLVPAKTKGVRITPMQMADARASAMVEFDKVELPADATLGQAKQAFGILESILDIGAIMLSAEMLGSIQAAFDKTLEWLKERKQFDVPIGSFQALQHRAADMFCEIELCQAVVSDALSALDEQRNDIARTASLTKTRLSEASRHITNECLQMHGGLGVTDDMDVGLYLKRARVAAAMLGDANYHTSRYARLGGY